MDSKIVTNIEANDKSETDLRVGRIDEGRMVL